MQDQRNRCLFVYRDCLHFGLLMLLFAGTAVTSTATEFEINLLSTATTDVGTFVPDLYHCTVVTNDGGGFQDGCTPTHIAHLGDENKIVGGSAIAQLGQALALSLSPPDRVEVVRLELDMGTATPVVELDVAPTFPSGAFWGREYFGIEVTSAGEWLFLTPTLSGAPGEQGLFTIEPTTGTTSLITTLASINCNNEARLAGMGDRLFASFDDRIFEIYRDGSPPELLVDYYDHITNVHDVVGLQVLGQDLWVAIGLNRVWGGVFELVLERFDISTWELLGRDTVAWPREDMGFPAGLIVRPVDRAPPIPADAPWSRVALIVGVAAAALLLFSGRNRFH